MTLLMTEKDLIGFYTIRGSLNQLAYVSAVNFANKELTYRLYHFSENRVAAPYRYNIDAWLSACTKIDNVDILTRELRGYIQYVANRHAT